MTHIRLYRALGILLSLAILAVGCSSSSESDEKEPDFTGIITMVSPTRENGSQSQILVESLINKSGDKYMVAINDKTQVFEQNSNTRYQLASEALASGQQVHIWFSGPVMESFPMQGTAQQVVITTQIKPTHRQLAEYWAPIWWQDTDNDDFRADYITNFNFDGDWDPSNNWDNLPHFVLKAYVYYWVVETTTHWFIGYATFHPRDWSDDITAFIDQHENDMEGCLLVIQKSERSYGQFILLITRAHDNFYSYIDDDISPSNNVRQGNEDIDGDVQFESYHPYIYVKAEGHAVYGDLRWENDDFPGGDGVVYRYMVQAMEPNNGNDRNVGYELVNIDDLWTKRYDPDIFYEFGVFKGDDWGNNKAHAPWGWDDKDDGEVSVDQFFVDPAYLVAYYHGGLGDFSHDYIVQYQSE
jgi:hypothetical protein